MAKTKTKTKQRDACKGCRRKLVGSYCWPESKKGWHYRYCSNTKGHCKYAAGAVRQ